MWTGVVLSQYSLKQGTRTDGVPAEIRAGAPLPETSQKGCRSSQLAVSEMKGMSPYVLHFAVARWDTSRAGRSAAAWGSQKATFHKAVR
jgi:hypothetical protein